MEIEELKDDRIVIDYNFALFSECKVVRYGLLDPGRGWSENGMCLDFSIGAWF
jgi:hypothetical protein